MARTRASDYDNKRESMLAAAARLFGEQGFDGVGMAAVAAECGVSKALLYHYYPSKDALLDDIVVQHLERLIAVVIDASAPAAAPEVRLRSMVRALLQCYRDDPDGHRVLQRCQVSLGDERMGTLHALERALVQQFAAVIREAVPSLRERPELLQPLTLSLFGILNWTYTWFREDGAIDRDGFADLVTTVMINGARAL